MTTTKTRSAIALVGTAALVGSVGLGAAPAFAGSEAPVEPVAVDQACEDVSSESPAASKAVEGTFSFDQNRLTPTSSLGVFQKAAAALCVALPQYMAPSAGVTVTAQGDEVLAATVEEMVEDGEETSSIVGCACSSNLPGGGAVANVSVSGMTVAALASLASIG